MNREIGKCIGSGASSEVFEWGCDKVVKLYRSNTSDYEINREFQNSEAAWESGLPVARPFDLVDVDGRPGIIFEKIIGETIKDRFFIQLNNPKNISLPITEKGKARFYYENNDILIIARLLFDIHKKSIPGILTIQKENLKRSIEWPSYLTNNEKQSICKYLDDIPDKNCLCHGDPNPNNIIIRDGKPVIIDWMNATIGNPVADIAEFIIMLKYAVLPSDTPYSVVNFFNATREITNDIFIGEYIKLSGMKYEEIDEWILPMAARKLSSDGIPEEEKSILVDVIRRRLYDL